MARGGSPDPPQFCRIWRSGKSRLRCTDNMMMYVGGRPRVKLRRRCVAHVNCLTVSLSHCPGVPPRGMDWREVGCLASKSRKSVRRQCNNPVLYSTENECIIPDPLGLSLGAALWYNRVGCYRLGCGRRTVGLSKPTQGHPAPRSALAWTLRSPINPGRSDEYTDLAPSF
jgi:hypothetical protein